MQPEIVVDASALLAYLQREKGYVKARKAILQGAVISTVNLAEIFKKTVEKKRKIEKVTPRIKKLGLLIAPFEEDEAVISAELYPIGKPYDLSFADRACIALGIKLDLPILTAERQKWSKLEGLDVDFYFIR